MTNVYEFEIDGQRYRVQPGEGVSLEQADRELREYLGRSSAPSGGAPEETGLSDRRLRENWMAPPESPTGPDVQMPPVLPQVRRGSMPRTALYPTLEGEPPPAGQAVAPVAGLANQPLGANFVRQLMRSEGMGSAPTAVHNMRPFVMNPRSIEGVREAIRAGTGQENADVRQLPNGLIYYIDREGRRILLDEPGRLSAGDLAALGINVAAAAPEVAALLMSGGLPALGRFGVYVAGGAATAGIGEYLRQSVGRYGLGTIPREQSGAGNIQQAATIGAITGGVAPVVTGVARTMIRGSSTPAVLGQMDDRILRDGMEALGRDVLTDAPAATRDVVMAAAQRYRDMINAIDSGAPMPGSPTRQELLRLESDANIMASTFEGLEQTATRFGDQEVARVRQQRGQAEMQAPGAISPPTQRPSAADVGERLQPAARAAQQQIEGSAPEVTLAGRARDDARDIVNGLMTESTPGREIGGGVREALQRSVNRINDFFDARYSPLRQLRAGHQVTISPETRQMATRLANDIDSALFSNLTPEDKAAVRSLNEQLERSNSGTFDFQIIDNAIRDLNAAQRTIGARLPADRRKSLAQMAERLREDRDAALRRLGGDDIVAMQRELDGQYRLYQGRLERDTIGQLLEPSARGDTYALANEKVFDRIFRATSNDAGIIAEAIGEGQREQVARAIRQRWARSVLRDGQVDVRAHARFMAEYGPNISKFMTPGQIAAMDNAQLFARNVANAEATEKAALEGLRRMPIAGVADATSFEEVAERGLSMRPSQIPLLMDAMQGVPGLQDQFRNLARSRLLQQVTNADEGVSLDALRRAIDPASESGQRLQRILEPADYRRLEQVARELSRIRDVPAIGSGQSDMQRIANNIIRAQVGLFTVAGRVFTALQRTQKMQSDAAISRAIRDPAYLAEFARVLRMTPGTRAAQQLLTRLGLESFVEGNTQ